MIRRPAWISFRERPKGGDLRVAPVVSPPFALRGWSRVLLFIHGFNNDSYQAEDSFKHFHAEQLRMGSIPTRVVFVYWPGDTGILGYPVSIQRARETAPRLAALLEATATVRGSMEVSVVAHSMGCRLTLELIELLAASKLVRVRRVVFMAAAVPLRRLQSPHASMGPPLRAAFESVPAVRVLSLFSPDDGVLRGAFVAGQLLADRDHIDDSGSPPVALGYARWTRNSVPPAKKLLQRHARYAGHGSYWQNDGGAIAPVVRKFLQLGRLSREFVERDIASRQTVSRTIANGFKRVIRSWSVAL